MPVRDGVQGQLAEHRKAPSSPAARAHLDALSPLKNVKMAEPARRIALRYDGDLLAVQAGVRAGVGKQAMDAIWDEFRVFSQMRGGASAASPSRSGSLHSSTPLMWHWCRAARRQR